MFLEGGTGQYFMAYESFCWITAKFQIMKLHKCDFQFIGQIILQFCSMFYRTHNFEVTLWVINVIYMFFCAYNIDCKHGNEYTGLFSYYYVTFFANFRMTQKYCAYASLIKCSISYDFKDL